MNQQQQNNSGEKTTAKLEKVKTEKIYIYIKSKANKTTLCSWEKASKAVQ